MTRTTSLMNRVRKMGAVAGAMALVATGSLQSPASAAVVGVTTTVALSTTTPAAGQPFTVTLSYSCASVVVDCLGAGVVLNVPAGLDDPSAIQGSTHVATTAFSPTSRNIRFTFVNPLAAGSTGQVQFTTAFTMGPTPNGAFADFVASMYTSNVGTDASNTVRATATASSRWAAATSVVSQGPIGNDTVFKLNVCDATTTTYGRTNLLDEYFVDALPPRSVFTGASDGGVYDAPTHTVRWRLSTLVGPNGCLTSVRVSVNFPDAAFNPGDVVTNNVTGSGHVPGLSALKPVTFVPASVSITLAGPNPVITATKTTTTTNLVPGDKVSYVVSLKNTGNVVLDTVSFTDVFPVGTSILPGGRVGIGNTAGQQVKIYYSTARTPRTATSFVALGAGGLTGTSTAGSYTTAPNPLAGNASGITALRYLYLGTLNPGQTVSVQIDVVYDDVDDTGAPLAVGTAVNNCAAVRWYYNAALGTTGPCANLVVPTPAPSVQLTMSNCCSTSTTRPRSRPVALRPGRCSRGRPSGRTGPWP